MRVDFGIGALRRRFRRAPYDVEADWTLLFGCNYRCAYCFFPPDSLAQPIRAYASPAQWRAAFDAGGRTWLIHITGGEPTAYPGFAELCRVLCERHFLSVNTNLSRDSVLSVIGSVDPQRIRYIHASLHPDERSRKKGLDGFVARATALRDGGFNVLVSIVATPEALADFDLLAEPLRAAGIAVAPKLLRGPFRGQVYPQSYSEAERERFRAATARAKPGYADLEKRLGEPPTIDVLGDVPYLAGVPSYRGRHCDAGFRFVAIDPDGTVRRCGASAPLGNLLAGSLKLWNAGAPCDSDHCFYFCRKYSRPEPSPSPRAA